MSAVSPDFVGRLCLALAHRREPERIFVILTAYFDESGTHGGDKSGANAASSFLVMAGIMGNVAQWARFQVGLDRLRSTYGFRVFHGKEFNARSGEFKGWTGEKSLALLNDLSDLAATGLMQGCVFPLNRLEFQTNYKRDAKPAKVRLDTEYGLSFRCCLKYLTDDAIRRNKHHKKFDQTKLNVVLEHGHKNVGDAQRVFFAMKETYRAEGTGLLDTFIMAEKGDADPLMIADFLAHTIYANQPDKWARAPWPSQPGNARTPLTHIGLAPGTLGHLRDGIERLRRDSPSNRDPSSSLLTGVAGSSPLARQQSS